MNDFAHVMMISPGDGRRRVSGGLPGDVGSGPAGGVVSLLGAYQRYLLGLACAVLSPRLRSRIEPMDLVQETMALAVRDYRQFRGDTEAAFRAWLRRVLLRCCGKMVRRHTGAGRCARDAGLSLDDPELGHGLRERLASRDAGPEERASRKEDLEQIARGLVRLSPDDRRVIRLRSTLGLSFFEVARRMGRSEPAARRLFARAIGRLRRKVRGPAAGR